MRTPIKEADDCRNDALRRMIGSDFESVLHAARAGDERAILVLYRDLNPSLMRFLEMQVPGSGEELSQEVWFAAAKRLARFVGDERGFRAFVFTIARRHVIAQWRRRGRQPEQLVDPANLEDFAVPVRGTPETQILEEDALRRLVAHLPSEQAEIVLLRVVAGFSAEEVAAIVGKRPGTVRVMQHRALRAMAERLDEVPVTK